MTLPADVLRGFPNLKPTDYSIESVATWKYNCVAFAAGDTARWWQPFPAPHVKPYWPAMVPGGRKLVALVNLFRRQGFSSCAAGQLETGFLKVALYARPDGTWTHVARQLESGRWVSKLGSYDDIMHGDADVLAGGMYGSVAQYMRKATKQTSGS